MSDELRWFLLGAGATLLIVVCAYACRLAVNIQSIEVRADE